MDAIRGTAILLLGLLAACGDDQPSQDPATPRGNRDDPPVALDPEPLVEYPAALYRQGVEGTVTLRLFVDEKGTVVRESTQVAESSGYPAFDSAALAGVPKMHFAPAQRGGRPVAMTFTQPVHFRKTPAGGTVTPPARTVTPSAESISPAAEPVAPAPESVTPAAEPATPATDSVTP